MNPDTDDRRVGALVFRPGEMGFVFYDDRGPFASQSNQPARTWAFSTIEETAAWLLAQFRKEANVVEKRASDAEPLEDDFASDVGRQPDRISRMLDFAPEEGSVDQLLLHSLRNFGKLATVTLYVGDVRRAIQAARLDQLLPVRNADNVDIDR